MVKKRNCKIGKKGALLDVLYIATLVFLIITITLICFKIASSFNTEIQSNSMVPADGKAAATQLTNYYPSLMDKLILFITIGLAIVSLILAALVRIHPVFIPFFIIGLTVVIFLCGILSNIYEQMATSTAFVAQANQLVYMSFIITKLPFIIGVIGIILMVVMYKLWRADQF